MLLNTLKRLHKNLNYPGFVFIIATFTFLTVSCSDAGSEQSGQLAVSNAAESNRTADKEKDEDNKTAEFKIKEASWDDEKNRLKVKGKGTKDETVAVSNAGSDAFIADDKVDKDSKWEVKIEDLSMVPYQSPSMI